MKDVIKTLSPDDSQALTRAHQRLEHASLAARLSGVVGTPIEVALKLLPGSWYQRLHGLAETGVARALETAISGLHGGGRYLSEDRHYKVLGACTGAMGGAFGLPGLVLELPVSTTLMLRSIADIAHSEGEDLATVEARLACMEVFALGGRTTLDDAADTGYYGVRLMIGMEVTAATRHVLARGLEDPAAPVLARLVSAVASRLQVPLSQKAAAMAVPAVGAATAATLNVIFMQHFQDMARGHFVLRRLERSYGKDTIRAAYAGLSAPRAA